jgi:Ca2+-binding EF-hand superfamily protein
MLTRARPSDPPPPTTKSTPKRPRPNHPPPPLNKDVDDLGSIGSLDSHEPDELDKEEEQMLQLSALQDASSALRDLALEKAAAESKTKIEILTKDEEGRVVVDTVQAMVDKSTEEMTAHEMDQFISSLPIDNLFKTFDLDGSGAIDFDEFSKMLPQINIHIPEAQALKFFAACDSDGSGEIDQEEFCVCLIAATNAVNRGSNNENHTVLTPLDAFQLFDEDGSNSIDFTEFNALCDYCGLSHINEKQRKKNFKRFDEDGGGTLDFEEFKLTWILMTDPFQQAKAHQLPLHRFDTKAEVREKVMRYLEKIEEIDEVSMVDAQRWVDFHHEKMNREREERDKLITSREYWRDLPSDQWSLRLMVESLNKLGYDTGGM